MKISDLIEEEDRNLESIRLVLKKNSNFIKKVFSRYTNARGGKKDFFNEDNDSMAQVDLLKFCKEKNL